MDNVTDIPEEPASPVTFAFATSTGLIIQLSVMIVVAVVGNVCTIAAFHMDSALRSNPSDKYILSLAWGNLGIGMCAMPAQLICRILWRPLPLIICRLMYTLDYSFAAVTLYMITLICIDRYFLVSSSYSRYIAIQTRRNIRWTILMAWLLAIIVGASQNLSWGTPAHEIFNSYTPCCTGPVIAKKIPLVILYVCYGIIPSVLVGVFGTLFLVALRRRLQRWKEKGAARRSGDYHALKHKRVRVAQKIASSQKMPIIKENSGRRELRRSQPKKVQITADAGAERTFTRNLKCSSPETMETGLNAASVSTSKRQINSTTTAELKSGSSSCDSGNFSPNNSLPEDSEHECTRLLVGIDEEEHKTRQVSITAAGSGMVKLNVNNEIDLPMRQIGSYSPLPVRRTLVSKLTEDDEDDEEDEIHELSFQNVVCTGESFPINERVASDNNTQESSHELREGETPSNTISDPSSDGDHKNIEEEQAGQSSFRISHCHGPNLPEITIDPASSQPGQDNDILNRRSSQTKDPQRLHRPSIDLSGFSLHTLVTHLVSRGSSFRSSFRDMTPKIFRSRYIKPATVFGCLFVGMLICFIPNGVYMIVVTTACPECFDPVVFNSLAFLAYFNSCLNPVLYMISHPKIRRFYQRRFHIFSNFCCPRSAW